MANNCYHDQPLTPNNVVIGTHMKCNPVSRANHVVAPPQGNHLAGVSFAANPAGNTYFLPWRENGIASVALPMNPGPGDVQYFVTAAMHGCAFFIDSYLPTAAAGYPDTQPRLILYHANANRHYNNANIGIEPGAIRGNAQHFPALAHTQVINYRNAARTDYPGIKMAERSLMKPEYNAAINREMNRKRQQGRTQVSYGGRAFVVGFVQPGGWAFHYQVWGSVSYRRPAMAVKGWFLGRRRIATLADNRVLHTERFWP
jgi:hypothetical protein